MLPMDDSQHKRFLGFASVSGNIDEEMSGHRTQILSYDNLSPNVPTNLLSPVAVPAQGDPRSLRSIVSEIASLNTAAADSQESITSGQLSGKTKTRKKR
jgi:hypothetical protein